MVALPIASDKNHFSQHRKFASELVVMGARLPSSSLEAEVGVPESEVSRGHKAKPYLTKENSLQSADECFTTEG